ncbi:MAG: DNA polymerase III subunit gamma/tau [Actinomycetota bacterium]
MAYVSLYRKYRPQTFSEILGQEHVSSTLANAITEDRVAHAYLFTGPRGTGKTSTARILAKALNCEKGPTPEPCGKCNSCVAIAEGSSIDVLEMDAASHSGVDETREILAGVSLATAGGRKKVYVIDEVHMLTTQSFNALLKTLEEPPDHVIFVLATTEAHKVLPTIVSRTQRFDFRRMPMSSLVELLTDVTKQEGIDIDPEAIEVIARHSDGGARDALSALDQLRSIDGHITVEHAERQLGERDEDEFLQLFDAVATADVGSVFTTLDSMIVQGADVRQVAIGTLQHARALLLLKTAPQAENLLNMQEEDRPKLAAQSEQFRIGGLLRLLDLVGKSITEMRNAPNHRLFLEVALARATSPETDSTPDGLLGRIERLERRIGLEGAEGPVIDTAPAIPEPQVRAATASSRPDPEPEPEPQPEEVPASPVPATSAPQPSSSTDHLGLGHVKDAWSATMKEVAQRSKRVHAFLNPSRPVSLDDEGLVVEVQSGFHATQMAGEGNRSVLVDAIQAALGIKPKLLFAERGARPVGGDAGGEAEDEARDEAPTPSPRQDNPGSYADAAEAEDVHHDPVELVKKDLRAEVVREIDE